MVHRTAEVCYFLHYRFVVAWDSSTAPLHSPNGMQIVCHSVPTATKPGLWSSLWLPVPQIWPINHPYNPECWPLWSGWQGINGICHPGGHCWDYYPGTLSRSNHSDSLGDLVPVDFIYRNMIFQIIWVTLIYTVRPDQNGWHFPNNIYFQLHFLEWNCYFVIQILLAFIP